MSEPHSSLFHSFTDGWSSTVRNSGIHLTARQRDVLRLLCEGMSNKLISRALNISAATVKVHVSSIFRALDVSSRLEAVVAARALGMIPAASRPLDHVVRNPSFPSPVGRLMLEQLGLQPRLVSQLADAE
ncbi:MAG: response regulator transcription factor [Burkholderiales bacterium]